MPENKTNCWEYLNCGYGPGSEKFCPATSDANCDGINHGVNAGRICWTLENVPCKAAEAAWLEPLGSCISCSFFLKVKEEEGEEFHLLKLGQAIQEVEKLHSCLSQIESLINIREQLFTTFDLRENIKKIAAEAKKLSGADWCGVYLLRGDPPQLVLETPVVQGRDPVVLPLDETTAVGLAAKLNQILNLHRPSNAPDENPMPVPFNLRLDEKLKVNTRCFAAIPFRDNDGRMRGVLAAANSEKGFFSPDDLWFLIRCGFDLSFAVEKAHFIEEGISAVRLASIGETVAGLAHCIKGIAHALRVSTFVMKKEIEKVSSPDLQAAFEILNKNVGRLADLSVDVLSYASGQPGLMVRSDLNQTVKDAVRLLEAEASVRGIKFSAVYGEQLEDCLINPSRIYRCVVNLIINAFDACTPRGGSVTVRTEKIPPNQALISVIDTGCGMDESTKVMVFDLFKTTKQRRKGTGIGLPTVYDIVHQHGGRIEIDSKKGLGTTFNIFLNVN